MATEFEKELEHKADEVVSALNKNISSDNPVLLYGQVQAGKTACFLRVISKCFEKNIFDVVIIITQNKIALTKQTLSRSIKHFEQSVLVKDVANIKKIGLNKYQKNNFKIVLIIKKHVANFDWVSKILEMYNESEMLDKKRFLIVDDEADNASVGFKKEGQSSIANEVDQLRKKFPKTAYLQVTATPFALFLLPNDSIEDVFLKKRPFVTNLLPIHDEYVGGRDYFEDYDSNNVRHYLYNEFSDADIKVLQAKKEDLRKTKKGLINNKNFDELISALMNFFIGVIMQRMQSGCDREHFSFVVHVAVGTATHKFQADIIKRVIHSMWKCSNEDKIKFNDLFNQSYDNIKSSMLIQNPNLIESKESVREKLLEYLSGDNGEIDVVILNSENDVASRLNDKGEVALDAPACILIGGMILDRGLTISNLIGFLYGRTTKQADSILQHARLYGARKKYLSITRFYTSAEIYASWRYVYETDKDLRYQYENEINSKTYIRLMDGLKVTADSKTRYSDIEYLSVGRGASSVPKYFKVKPKSRIKSIIKRIDKLVPISSINDVGEGTDDISKIKKAFIKKDTFEAIIDNIAKTIEINTNLEADDLWRKKMYKIIESCEENHKDDILVISYLERSRKRKTENNMALQRDPLSEYERNLIKNMPEAKEYPVLMLFRQKGTKDLGWEQDYPFWWPALYAPQISDGYIYMSERS